MHDAVLVQIADSLQHLLNHPAGIFLRVHPPVQNAVKELAPWNTEQEIQTLNKKLQFNFIYDVRNTHSSMMR